MKGDIGSMRGDLGSIRGDIIKIKAGVNRLCPPKPPINSTTKSQIHLTKDPILHKTPVSQIQTHHQPNPMPLLHKLESKENEVKPQNGEKLSGWIQ